MAESSVELIALTSSFSSDDKNNIIENYLTLGNKIQTIQRRGRHGTIALHVSNYYGDNEVFQLLLTDSALKSLEYISYDLSRQAEIRYLYLKCSNLFYSHEQFQDFDYIEWSLTGKNLIKKRREFREQIDLYKTYDNQHHLITKLLIEIIDYYFNEYLIKQEDFPIAEIKKLEFYFKEAIKEKNYLIYFIKAYTLTNSFHHLLNKHLALYILDYFDTSSYSSSKTKYRLINCLVHIVTLLIHHPDIKNYIYTGSCYRGLFMTENDLKYYNIDEHILNRSFLSTSKNRSVAEMYAGDGQQNLLQQTSNHVSSRRIPVLLKYTIKQKQTAIDIEHISTIEDEKEVLILPFSVFKIKNRIENKSSEFSSRVVEIDLEECEDDEQVNSQVENNESLTSLRDRTKKKFFKSKYFYGSIGLCIIVTLILTVSSLTREKDAKWKQEGITVAGGNGSGNLTNQLSYPGTIRIDVDQTIYITDSFNHRIVRWTNGATNGQIVAGGNGLGNQTNQLNYPGDVIIDKQNNSLVICDSKNRRIMRWSLENATKSGEIIIDDTDCANLIMDKNGSFYVSDSKIHGVRRWKRGDQNGTIIAGGNQYGNRLDQFFGPSSMFIDEAYSLFVSDWGNHRVMKWLKDAKKGLVVAGGNGQGNSLTQLNNPLGVVVDQSGKVYVADWNNNRVMRWSPGAKKGAIVVDGNGQDGQPNQFDHPTDVSFDQQGNLYVVDQWNHRIRKFERL